ncbi:MAG TPA: vitamin K epoxide reductase family protein [Candidatus Binatus sp.]|nr:vitamin K epoxide reductase family protein [Candidatus Binatus sp.]
MSTLATSLCISALCLVGLYVSSHMYAKAVRYERGAVDSPSVVQSPRARVLGGVPNAAVGLVYYGAMLIVAWGIRIPLIWIGAVVAASAAALLSVYLAYSLLLITKQRCPFCWTGHVLNWAILALLIEYRAL